MPWDCQTCGHHVEADSSAICPQCNAVKPSWTVVQDRTRQIVVTRARFECLRGRVPAPTGRGRPLYEPEALDPTEEARVVTKAAALALAASGLQPASLDILVVRLQPRRDVGHVDLAIEFTSAVADERGYPVPVPPYIDVPFLFVAGPEALPPDLAFAGLHVVDVTEDSERGFAPTVGVTALKQRTVELTTVAAQAPVTVHRVEPTAVRFAQGSALSLPREELEHHPLLGLVIAAGFLADHPDHRLLLVGHASPEGGDAHNRKLSRARAEGLAQLIRGERDPWVDTATNHGSLADVKAYLSYLTRERGWSCDPGPVTPVNDARAKAGVKAFQGEYNRRFEGALAEDGVCGVKTLGAIFDVLCFELDRWLDKHGTTRQALRLAEPATLGAGEAFVDHPALPAPATEENRRFVDLLLLPPALGPVAEPAAVYDHETAVLRELPVAAEPGAWEVGAFTIVTDLLPDDVEVDERYRLVAADGSFDVEQSVPVHGLVRNGGIEVEFDRVPAQARYTLTVTSAEGKVSTPFKDVPFGELHALSTRLPSEPPKFNH